MGKNYVLRLIFVNLGVRYLWEHWEVYGYQVLYFTACMYTT